MLFVPTSNDDIAADFANAHIKLARSAYVPYPKFVRYPFVSESVDDQVGALRHFTPGLFANFIFSTEFDAPPRVYRSEDIPTKIVLDRLAYTMVSADERRVTSVHEEFERITIINGCIVDGPCVAHGPIVGGHGGDDDHAGADAVGSPNFDDIFDDVGEEFNAADIFDDVMVEPELNGTGEGSKDEGVVVGLSPPDVEIMCAAGVHTDEIGELVSAMREHAVEDSLDAAEMPDASASASATASASSSSTCLPPATNFVSIESLVAELDLSLRPGFTIWKGSTKLGHCRHLFGRSVKTICGCKGHSGCSIFMNFHPHGFAAVNRAALAWLARGPSLSREEHVADGELVVQSLRATASA